ncbi:MAG: PLAT/LH2 domain-containing protein [Candidatus Limnocylindria bacterium]
MTQPKQPYLFVLLKPSTAVRREAATRLRELGLRVVAQYGEGAIEALATGREAQSAQDLGLFAAVLKGPMKAEHEEGLTEDQRRTIAQWNTRFTLGYRDLRKDLTHLGRSWADKEVAPPAPYSAIAPEDFLRFMEEYARRTGKAIRPAGRQARPRGKRASKPMGAKEFQAYEKKLADRHKDPSAAYHLSRLAYQLGPEYYDTVARLDPDVVRELITRFFREEGCWELTGEMSVGLVFVESSRSGGPTFGNPERAQICQEIIDGLNWLASEHPSGNLSWVYDLQFTRIDAANGDDTVANCPISSLEAGWRDPAIARVNYFGTTYAADWASVAAYREDMRTRNLSAHAFVVFVTPYANCWHAYAGGGRIVLARHNNWGGWGRSNLDRIAAHETTHLFGSADEYTGSGTPCSTCDSLHGCDQIPNGNCGACARPQQACVMRGNDRRLCGYTRGQIGWSDLFVELMTGDVAWAGTDDDVWLDIGNRTWVLDTLGHDDRERNNREGHAIWAPALDRAQIKRIMIRKSPDGWAGGWRLAGVGVRFRGEVICDAPAINQWLEDDHRTWVGCLTDASLVNTLRVEVGTADVRWAGTDDDVSITLAGRSWNLDNPWHNDFERGHTDGFNLDPGTGLYLTDIHSVTIHKSPDGLAGGWKLKGVNVVANGATIFNNQSINKWLEDNDRNWSASW